MADAFLLASKARAWALVVFFCLVASLSGQTTNVSVSPPPDWVRLCGWNMPTNRLRSGESEGSRYLLYERQDNPQRQETFTRMVLLMENQTGVQDEGSVTLGFDPSFQELILHRVQIHRDGKALERLERSKVRIIQPEPELDGHLFTGRQQAVLFVEDLRVGDALEYSYTIRGANPVLGGHYAAEFRVQTSVPMARRRLRVVWPADKPLYLRQYLTAAVPQQAPCDGGLERVWDFANQEAIPYEDDLPVTYEAYPYVELSDFADWSRVVEWALPLYAVGASNLPPELRDLLAKWQASATGNEERARLALDFVQDELRYTGIELGPDSYRPANPFETFRLRYGDCKAKALLLCTLLREMHLEAYPALVDTSARETVALRLASPFAFNHCIVKLLLDGRTVWVDPTRSHQGASLWARHLPRLGKALVIKPGGTALEDIAPSRARSLLRVTSTFKLKDYTSPAALTVHSAYHGAEADSMRQYLARTEVKEITKEYLNFYARYYPGVRELRPLEVLDQRATNVLQVTEYYQVQDLWKLNKTGQRWEASFQAENLQKMLTDPDTRFRKMPLGIPYPSRREQEVVVCLPDKDWNIPPLEGTVECEVFSFHHRRKAEGATVRFAYDCETKAPSVPAERVAEYLKKLEEMQNLLNDLLYRPAKESGPASAQLNLLMVVVAGFGLSATLAGGLWLWRRARVPIAATADIVPILSSDPTNLQGLRGWLLLLGFGLCFSLVQRLTNLAQQSGGYFSTVAWQSLAVPGGGHYHPFYGPLLIFELLGNIVLLGMHVLAVGLFFAQRRMFPRLYITLMVANVVYLLADELLGATIPYVAENSHSSGSPLVVRAALQATLWSAYMLKSRRVKATFVR